MRYGITVRETLERLVVVEKDSLEDAIEYVQEAYETEQIVLDAGDVVPVEETGTNAEFFQAEYIDSDELFTITPEVFDV